MFTGLVEEIGIVRDIKSISNGRIFHIGASRVCDDLSVDDSVAVEGVCLTVTQVQKEYFICTAVMETLKRTTLSGMKTGTPVNLERALRPADRMGGHWVQGHVDDTGIVRIFADQGSSWNLVIEIPGKLTPFCVEKGSITVNGISLTVAGIEENRISVSVIPHTFTRTTLRYLKKECKVNIETDILAKYIKNLLDTKQNGPAHDESWYRGHGF